MRIMISRRGMSKCVFSDNDKSFHGANNELTKMLNDKEEIRILKKEMTSRTIEWNFIPPLAPHQGDHGKGWSV